MPTRVAGSAKHAGPVPAPDDAGTALVHAEGVRKSFGGVAALIDGRIDVRRGSVHALCGGNGAGKSTFLNILTGLQTADAGRIEIKGRPVRYASPVEAMADGIAIITQELSPVLDRSVAENIYLGREPRRGGVFVDDRRLIAMARDLLEQLGFDVDPKARLRSLSIAQMQLVEIAKAISQDSDILIMDEPTSAIGERETGVLFEAIRSLQSQGVGIIYVSHRLTDIFTIADSYTVLRDGRFVESGTLAGIDRQGLIKLIVGRDLVDRRRSRRPLGPPLLETRDLSRANEFDGISLSLREGEVLGIYGLMGAGRSEFLSALYGLTRPDRGEIEIAGETVTIDHPAQALRHGLALVTEDRKLTGLVATSSVRDNVSIASLPALSRLGFVDRAKERAAVDGAIDRLAIKATSRDAPVTSLSGGNQQKVVLARCLQTQPRILLCDEPTRGVDEGAKREIYHFLEAFVARGGAVIFVSSELPELLANTDRIVAFRRGRMVAALDAAEATQEALVHLAS